ncbi:hypothetical protein ABTM60_20780, partial [Acinetobacter baumannii]
WFSCRDEYTRLKIVAGLAGVIAATGASKTLQSILYLHPRPLVVADDLGLRLPEHLFTQWGSANSFPSDTASAYFALA